MGFEASHSPTLREYHHQKLTSFPGFLNARTPLLDVLLDVTSHIDFLFWVSEFEFSVRDQTARSGFETRLGGTAFHPVVLLFQSRWCQKTDEREAHHSSGSNPALPPPPAAPAVFNMREMRESLALAEQLAKASMSSNKGRSHQLQQLDANNNNEGEETPRSYVPPKQLLLYLVSLLFLRLNFKPEIGTMTFRN
ncbi:hypothetical protein DAPPUDRAFT_244433 [Daphnia pulex]|uniref:Uncharacterized protein n=1 Tax=Daphnia pulex TaxID=6669 RepID=E9GKY4_DAPPU|nr:hypothetical protein DAPPUDRAFT_244433 [Daphnia pulex]|eukprot:EFX79759.1 hypothetical protein DAPPUDRAFT_244433 [Daphnia pulex]